MMFHHPGDPVLISRFSRSRIFGSAKRSSSAFLPPSCAQEGMVASNPVPAAVPSLSLGVEPALPPPAPPTRPCSPSKNPWKCLLPPCRRGPPTCSCLSPACRCRPPHWRRPAPPPICLFLL